MTPLPWRPAQTPWHVVLLSCLTLVLATACSGPEQTANARLTQLKQALKPGLPLPEARSMLQTQGVTFSEKTAVECDTLARQSRVQTQLTAQGGPCLFGKLPLPRNWYGAKTDIILQLVFNRDGVLVDGNFEALETFL